MLGIAVYPEKADQQAIIDYINLAAKYGFKRLFTCLLSAQNQTQATIKNQFGPIIQAAQAQQMETIIDLSPHVLQTLGISYDDLSFFANLGVTGLRLDQGFDGWKEAQMSHNPYGLKIEINASGGNKAIDNILSFNPDQTKLLACHNFYPMEYAGLSWKQFEQTSKHFKKLGIRLAAFVGSQAANHGPWQAIDGGLCTLEMHRYLPLTTQVKHLLMTNLVDDLIIGNAFATEAELQAISQMQMATFTIELLTDLSPLEEQILFNERHFNRGDLSEYLIRSYEPRIKFRNEDLPAKNCHAKITKGMVVIGNNQFLQYKGELQIALKNHFDHKGRKNVVAKIVEHELFLLDYLKPWAFFQFQLAKKSNRKQLNQA